MTSRRPPDGLYVADKTFWVATIEPLTKEVSIMFVKRILSPQRLRRVPNQFSWVDQRLVRDGFICGIGHRSLSLYLFLVTVSDADGLSYYSDASLGHYLGFDPLMAQQARAELCAAELIAYVNPLYQVLSLQRPQSAPTPPPHLPLTPRCKSEPVSLGDFLRHTIGGAR
jgi:hypothetical protein